MDVFEADEYFIIQDGNHSLWCNRQSGDLCAKHGSDLCKVSNPICLGKVYGVIGKVKVLPGSDWQLIIIKQQSHVGYTADKADVYRIGKVALLPLSKKGLPSSFDLPRCEKHNFTIARPKQLSQQGKQMLQSTWNSFQKVKDTVQSKKGGKDPQKEYDRLEKRLNEELAKMFNISDFYYYSPNGDITNSVQRQNSPSYKESEPLWKRADERFFWNKALLDDLINSNDPLADRWIQPIIQGFFEVKTCSLSEWTNHQQSSFYKNVYEFSLTVLSRRSRHRAGTRYKRRGVDVDGNCANYVETEQIVKFKTHTLSYVQVRGSIPVYWSQPGHKYRPPPILDKGEKETVAAFAKHFEQQLSLYRNVHCLSLVERTGREKIVADAFLNHIVLYNNPSVAYVAFDFHEYCRGMQFDNVAMLTDAIQELTKSQKYCWVDGHGMICEQSGIFRVNCIDCLDRTNVVQTAVARIIIDQQVRKLGLLTPDEQLPDDVKQLFNQLWANNGDAISRQYAGTAAMKGDYTRTGERKFSGLMRDGVKSASRYLIHRFKDLYRQAAIDIQLGQPLDQDILVVLAAGQQTARNEQDEIDYIREKASDVVSVIHEARDLLIVNPENCLGGWAVISLDCKQDGVVDDNEMDTILLLTNCFYYFVSYDDELDCLSDYQRIPITDLYAIDIGPYAASVFKKKFQCMRLWYKYHGEPGYFHTFRIPNVRAFNNSIVEIKGPDEEREILRAMAETMKVGGEMVGGLVHIRSTAMESKRFRRVARESVHEKSISGTLWNEPHKLANVARAVNKAASSVKEQVSSQLKKINLSSSRPSAVAEFVHSNTTTCIMSELSALDVDSNGEEDPTQSLVAIKLAPPTGTQSKAMSAGSLPDLNHEPDSAGLLPPPTNIHFSSPDIHNECEANADFATQAHHSTAPNLTHLDHHVNSTPEEDSLSPAHDHLKVSVSDSQLREFHSVLPDNGGAAGRSPLSKLKSGLSQVSQLIGNPNSSPHTRRRQHLLHDQLSNNANISNLRFKNCQTKILLL